MAYLVTNPPMVYVAPIGTMPAIWVYKSTDDDATTNGANYYSDGVTLGMKIGDIVIVVDTTTPKVSLHGVASVSGTAATTAFGAVA